MGIQYNTELIIGFGLDSDSVQKWISKNQVEDPYNLNEKLREKYPELNEITVEHLNIAKRVYKELTGEELKCNNVSDIRLSTALNVN